MTAKFLLILVLSVFVAVLPAPAQSIPLPESGPVENVHLSFVADRTLRLRFDGNGATPYGIEYSDDLVHWHLIPRPAESVNASTYELFDPAGIGQPRRYYRVRHPFSEALPLVPEPVFKRLGNLGENTGASTDSFTTSFPDSILVPENDPAFGEGVNDSNRMTRSEMEEALADGILAWRTPGTRGSCANCHSPDGFDLALIGYSDSDITRRALDHVSPEDAQKLVDYVQALRQRHGIERPLHPLKFRPLQPGHVILPGEDHEDRDLAFGNQLANELSLIWASGRIESREEALAAQAELLALDLRKLRVGIPFDRWSEDSHHGLDHLSVSEWLPNMAFQPDPTRAGEWYALVDAYLAEPSDQNFWAFYSRIDELLVPVEEGFELAQDWNLLKYKSVQVAQHMFRHQSLPYPDPLIDSDGDWVTERSSIIARNPLFRTGDHVRRFPLNYDSANPSTLFPAHLADTIPDSDEELDRQNINFQRVWFWMGWAYDPALLLSDDIFQTIEGDYLYASLLQHYKIHHAFVVAMTSVAKANATDFFSAPGPGVPGHGKWAAFNPFMVLHHIERNRNSPADATRLEIHDRMYSNTARMWIYLVQEDLERTEAVFDKDLVRGCIHFCRAWLDETEPGIDHTAIDAVVADIDLRLNTAQELRTDFSGPDLPGGLPFLQ